MNETPRDPAHDDAGHVRAEGPAILDPDRSGAEPGDRSGETAPTDPDRRPPAVRTIATLLVVAVLAAGAFGVVRYFAAADDHALDLVPADSLFYANVFLEPSTDQRRALRSLLERFPATETPERAEDRLMDLLDEIFQGEGFRFSTDVRPWLGSQVAVFFSITEEDPTGPSLDGAFLVEVEDRDAAMGFVEKMAKEGDEPVEERSYRGNDYLFTREGSSAVGIVGDFMVFGTEGGLRSSIDVAEDDDGLGGSPRYSAATEVLPSDRVAVMYLDPRPAVRFALREMRRTGEFPFAIRGPLVRALSAPQALALYLRDDAVVLEASVVSQGGVPVLGLLPAGDESTIRRLPAGSWVAASFADLGGSLSSLMDLLVDSGVPVGAFELGFRRTAGLDLRRDLLAWVDDVGLFVRGRSVSSVDGGIVITTGDPARAARFVRTVAGLLARQGLPVRDLTERSFRLQARDMPEPVNVIAGPRSVVIAYGRDATFDALGAGPRLARSPGFRIAEDSLGSDLEMSGYIDLRALVEMISLSGIRMDRTYREEIAPNLAPLHHVVSGSKTVGDRTVQRLVIGIR